MPDKYRNFSEMARSEPPDAYAVSLRDTRSDTVVAAPHGGGIEPGTSEVCLGIAGEDLSWYLFEGKKTRGNHEDLHLTSSNFDEPQCRELIRRSRLVVTVHGEGSDSDAVYIGGLHVPTIRALRATLGEAGFTVLQHANPNLQGKSPANICNLGQLGEGVQLELAKGLRRTLFEGQTLANRSGRTERFNRLCQAIRRGIQMAGSEVDGAGPHRSAE
jgi:phage replication-related protein YjqB (UPF0714/DUF867 family)